MQRVLYSIFNPYYSRPGKLYQALKKHMEHQTSYVFLDCPFASMPHPILMDGDAEVIHEAALAELVVFRDEKLLPALATGANVVCDGYCLDAYLAAAARASDDAGSRLLDRHRKFVEAELRNVKYHVPYPIYLRVGLDLERQANWLKEQLPSYATEKEFEEFPGKMADLIREYFKSDKAEVPSFLLQTESLSAPGDMLEYAANVVMYGKPTKERQFA